METLNLVPFLARAVKLAIRTERAAVRARGARARATDTFWSDDIAGGTGYHAARAARVATASLATLETRCVAVRGELSPFGCAIVDRAVDAARMARAGMRPQRKARTVWPDRSRDVTVCPACGVAAVNGDPRHPDASSFGPTRHAHPDEIEETYAAQDAAESSFAAFCELYGMLSYVRDVDLGGCYSCPFCDDVHVGTAVVLRGTRSPR